MSDNFARCRNCRNILMKSSTLLGSHSKDLGDKNNCGTGEHVTNYFINEDDCPGFIKEQITQTKGKVSCPECCVNIGSFDLTNSSVCSCGQITLPPISLWSDMVDVHLETNTSGQSTTTGDMSTSLDSNQKSLPSGLTSFESSSESDEDEKGASVCKTKQPVSRCDCAKSKVRTQEKQNSVEVQVSEGTSTLGADERDSKRSQFDWYLGTCHYYNVKHVNPGDKTKSTHRGSLDVPSSVVQQEDLSSDHSVDESRQAETPTDNSSLRGSETLSTIDVETGSGTLPILNRVLMSSANAKIVPATNPESVSTSLPTATDVSTTLSSINPESGSITAAHTVSTSLPTTPAETVSTSLPTTQTETVSTSLHTTQTETVSTSLPSSPAETVSTSLPATQTETMSTSLPTTQTETVSTSLPATQTETVSTSLHTTQTETVSTSLPTTQIETVSTSLPSSPAETVSTSLPATQTETVSTSLPTTQTETVSTSLPATQTETVSTSLPTTQAETVSTSLPTTQIETVSTSLPSSPAETVSTSLPATQTETVSTSLPTSPAETVSTSLHTTQTETVSTSLPTTQIETVSTSLPTSPAETVSTSLHTTQTETVSTSLPTTQTETVSTSLPTTQIETVSTSLPTSPAETVSTSLPATQTETVSTSLPATQIETVSTSLPTTLSSHSIQTPSTTNLTDSTSVTHPTTSRGSPINKSLTVTSSCMSSLSAPVGVLLSVSSSGVQSMSPASTSSTILSSLPSTSHISGACPSPSTHSSGARSNLPSSVPLSGDQLSTLSSFVLSCINTSGDSPLSHTSGASPSTDSSKAQSTIPSSDASDASPSHAPGSQSLTHLAKDLAELTFVLSSRYGPGSSASNFLVPPSSHSSKAGSTPGPATSSSHSPDDIATTRSSENVSRTGAYGSQNTGSISAVKLLKSSSVNVDRRDKASPSSTQRASNHGQERGGSNPPQRYVTTDDCVRSAPENASSEHPTAPSSRPSSTAAIDGLRRDVTNITHSERQIDSNDTIVVCTHASSERGEAKVGGGSADRSSQCTLGPIKMFPLVIPPGARVITPTPRASRNLTEEQRMNPRDSSRWSQQHSQDIANATVGSSECLNARVRNGTHAKVTGARSGSGSVVREGQGEATMQRSPGTGTEISQGSRRSFNASSSLPESREATASQNVIHSSRRPGQDSPFTDTRTRRGTDEQRSQEQRRCNGSNNHGNAPQATSSAEASRIVGSSTPRAVSAETSQPSGTLAVCVCSSTPSDNGTLGSAFRTIRTARGLLAVRTGVSQPPTTASATQPVRSEVSQSVNTSAISQPRRAQEPQSNGTVAASLPPVSPVIMRMVQRPPTPDNLQFTRVGQTQEERAAAAASRAAEEIHTDDLCTVCYDMMCCPQTVIPCGHMFCLYCIYEMKDRTQDFRCPMCRTRVQGYVLDEALEATLNERYPVNYRYRSSRISHYEAVRYDAILRRTNWNQFPGRWAEYNACVERRNRGVREREERERREREEREQERRERQCQETLEQERRERQRQETVEQERRERQRQETLERERRERQRQETLERERREREDQERREREDRERREWVSQESLVKLFSILENKKFWSAFFSMVFLAFGLFYQYDNN